MRVAKRTGNAPAEVQAIAHFLDWSLFEVGEKDGWIALKLALTAPPKAVKANYWLSWNGDRIARSRDWQYLQQDWPRLAQAVLEFLPSAQTAARMSGGGRRAVA